MVITHQVQAVLNEVAGTMENLHLIAQSLCSPVRVKVGVKDNQTTNTQVTAIMRDVGLRNYGEFNEPLFCNEAVLWAVDMSTRMGGHFWLAEVSGCDGRDGRGLF